MLTDLEFAYLCLAVSLLCSVALSFMLLRLRAALEDSRAMCSALERARASWRAQCMQAEARARGVGGQAGAKPTIRRVQA